MPRTEKSIEKAGALLMQYGFFLQTPATPAKKKKKSSSKPQAANPAVSEPVQLAARRGFFSLLADLTTAGAARGEDDKTVPRGTRASGELWVHYFTTGNPLMRCEAAI